MYQTLDAIDGKQARRTNSSSPLGELFDHGCDTISTILIALSIVLTIADIKSSDQWSGLMIFIPTLASFYFAHWQAYLTGTLRFGK